MNSCLSIILILLAALNKDTYQSCISVNVLEPRYYSRFSSHSSRWATTKKYIDCRNEIITPNFYQKVLPLATNSQIQWLQINNTDSPEIPEGAFALLKNVPDLRINGAGIQLIRRGAFDGLTSLTRLSLKDNKITEINEEHFINLTNLVELDLSFNNIASITETSFIGLKYLERLILQSNLLTTLRVNTFKDLSRVETLDLSFNKLTTTENGLFDTLKNLKTVRLNNNILNHFNGSTLSNNSLLQNIYINNNYIRSISNFSVPNSLLVLNASYNFIRSLNFLKYTSIQIIDLRSSGITSIDNSLLKNVSVVELHLDENHVGLNSINSDAFCNLSSLEVISLANNQIKQLKSNLFTNNKRVRKLNIAKNYLSSDDISNLPTSLQDLNVSFNNLNSEINMTTVINLKSLDISFNNVTEIKFNMFKGLKWLFQVDLSNNKISKIWLGSFRDLKILRELNLSNNRISVLEIGVFVGLDNLYSLNLAHNNLTTLSEGVFHNLRFLQILNLSFNNVSYSNIKNALSHLSALRQVGLAGNDWSCTLLTNLLKEYKRIKIVSAGQYDVTNVDGVACRYKVTESPDLLNLETTSFANLNSKLLTNNTLLILILVVIVCKIILQYIPLKDRQNRLKNKMWRDKSEQELQLVNNCE